ncbi:hypothetical protein QFC19_006359 [Naganishia cerealis]|uniref:Uncharacterized protein n=1 Tax=Naganishia cerealis TaxID=610337 RepID=A0ACC2VIW4_9TREE|nr:hypothetical protein QFC19_006359 [Naganishia cerealis]
MAFFKSRSASSSRRSSSVSLKPQPPNSEIFTSPPPGCVPKTRPTYTSEQQAQIEELRKYAFSLLLPESDPYHPWEKRFLSDPGCAPRYMRASKWKLDNAKERIKGTLEWRRDYKPELIHESDVSPEAETGKIILNGFDVDGRPILYMRPGRENQKTSPRQIRHLIFHLERAIDFMPPNVETVVIIVDYASATSQSNPSITTARQVLNILQNHYVERMGRAIVVNMPWWVNAFFTAITPFLDPVTKDKMRFNPKLPELVPVSQLDAEFGGENNFVFDHDIYWKTLVEYCHLAPDGGRLDKHGNPCIPPLGNGARAAFEDGADSTSADSTLDQRSTTTIDADQRSDSQETVNGTAFEVAASSAVPASDERVVDHYQLHSSMRDLSMDGTARPEGKHAESSPVNDTRSTSTFIYEYAFQSISIEEVPIVPTTQGPPAGPVVFDHPPTEEERLQAEALTRSAQQ